MKMIRRSEVCCSKMNWLYVYGEIVEVWEEIRLLNVSGMMEELVDVVSCAQIAFWDMVKINGWVFKTKKYDEWSERWDVWKNWLLQNELQFKSEYMRFGANYKRKEKREKVFSMASGRKVEIDGGYVFDIENGEIVGIDM